MTKTILKGPLNEKHISNPYTEIQRVHHGKKSLDFWNLVARFFLENRIKPLTSGAY